MDVAELILRIQGKDDASVVIKGVQEKAGGLGKTLGDISKIAGGFVVGAGIQKLGGFLVDAAKGAADDAASQARLQQAVENTGVSWDSMAGSLDGVIAKGQRLAFTDDQTRDSLSLLTAQTGDVAEATKRYALAQDLARGANIDVVTASKLLGKVTDENVSVLSRYGIAAKEGMTETELFGMVQEKFGGQAQKFADSTAGKMERLKDRMGELQETIGQAVLPVMTALADGAMIAVGVLEKLAALVGPTLASAFESVKGPLNSVKGTISGFVSALRGGTGAVGSFGSKARTLSGPLAALAGAIRSAVPQALDFLRSSFQKLQTYFRSDIEPAFQNIVAAIRAVVDVVVANWPLIEQVVRPVMDQVLNTIRTVVGIVGNLFAIIIDLIQGDFSGAWKNLQDLVRVVWDGIQETVRNATALLDGILTLAWEGIKLAAGLAWDGVKALISLAWDGIKSLVSSGVDEVVGFITSLPGRISGLAGEAASAGLALGKAIGNGVIDAINSLLDALSGTEIVPTIKVAGRTVIPGVSLPSLGSIPRLLAGMDYVPHDFYPALLDRGERVLTAGENRAYSGGSSGGDIIINGDVYGWDDFVRKVNTAVVDGRRFGMGYGL